MGQRVSVAQAAYLVRRDQRAVRYHLSKGHLHSTPGADGAAQIDVDELAHVRAWRIDAARLAELQAAGAQTASSMLARLGELERLVRELMRRVARLEGAGAAQTRVDGNIYPRSGKPSDLPLSASGDVSGVSGVSADWDAGGHADREPPPPARSARPTMRLGGALPEGLVSWRSFAKLHHVPATTAQKALDTGRLPSVEGRWKEGRAIVLRALDADGRRAFVALWGDRADFKRCADCPHAL